MQPSYPQNPRQRPLQKSMFLPQTEQYVNRTGQLDYQYQDMMKRSSINPDNNKFNGFQFPQPSVQPLTPVHQYNQSSSPVLNFSANTRYKEGPRQSQFEQLQPSQVNSQLAIQQLQQKITQLTQLVESHDNILKKHNLSNLKDKTLVESQVEEIETIVRQNVLPRMISSETKEIYEHIFNFKLQIQGLKDEVSEVNDKIKNELSSLVNGNSKSASTVNSLERIERIEEPFAELSANVYSLENKLTDIQKALTVRNDDLKSFILAQIQKSKNDKPQAPKSPSKLKPSTIQSTLPPIMLEYREIFAIKNSSPQPSSISRISSPRSRDEVEIVINSATYFIDREGYLLDSQNRYIVDARGGQIKLQEKHLALLKQYNVLG